jgi:hypothetical protein
VADHEKLRLGRDGFETLFTLTNPIEDQEEKEKRPKPVTSSGNPHLVRYSMDVESY